MITSERQRNLIIRTIARIMHTCIVSQRENEFHPVETRMNSMQNDAMTILCEDTGDPAAGRKMLTFIDERLNPEVSNG